MASAQRKVHSASEQAYLRAVECEEQAEDIEPNLTEAHSPEAKHSQHALPVEDTSEMFRQHSHQQSMEGG